MNKTLARNVLLLLVAVTSMANSKCEQKPLPESDVASPTGRILKKRVAITGVTGKEFDLPGGGSFDFGFAASTQLPDVVANSSQFALVYRRSMNQSRPSDLNYFTDGDQSVVDGFSSNTGESPFYSTDSDVACLVDQPQLVLSGDIVAFELSQAKNNGIKVGFNTGGSFALNSLETKWSAKTSQLDLILRAQRPLSQNLLASQEATGKQTAKERVFNIDLGILGFDFGYFHRSPAAQVTRETLSLALDGIYKSLESKKEVWYSRVMRVVDQEVIMWGGADTGVEVGDQFTIHRMAVAWSDQTKPCQSYYEDEMNSAVGTLATFEVKGVGDSMSWGQLIELPEPGMPRIRAGDRIYVKSLKETEKAPSPDTPNSDSQVDTQMGAGESEIKDENSDFEESNGSAWPIENNG